MDVFEKARILGNSGKYDSCGPKACQVDVEKGIGGIYHAKAEHKTCRIFKTLMTNTCSFDCKYCSNSAGCKKKPATFKQEELAKFFNYLNHKLDIDGLFLSSGVPGDPDIMTEKMISTVRLVRNKYNFRGYVHFKVLPGTSYELVKQAAEFSNRMSVNIEAPNSSVLSEFSSTKDFKNDILKRQKWISQLGLGSGQATQMIINHMSTDKDVLKMMNWEYGELKLKRMYFSAFRPVKGTPFENEKAESHTRESHLYNVDFLVRRYNYKFKEFNEVLNDDMLPREDPKLALAKLTFDGPVDINEASYDELIRIPGIGPRTAQRILAGEKIRKYEDLHKLGGWVERAKPFIEVDGKRQTNLIEF
ncbi:helix-hairpin-helix domain-containing protein [Candidatus Woesearchaeota archaeon]|nr:helix-hairpin-helix domain-containing protein [Candidatus Woesearchaeota archaeon]